MWGSYEPTYVRRRHCTPLICRYHLQLYFSYVRYMSPRRYPICVYIVRVFASFFYRSDQSLHGTPIQELLPTSSSFSLVALPLLDNSPLTCSHYIWQWSKGCAIKKIGESAFLYVGTLRGTLESSTPNRFTYACLRIRNS